MNSSLPSNSSGSNNSNSNSNSSGNNGGGGASAGGGGGAAAAAFAPLTGLPAGTAAFCGAAAAGFDGLEKKGRLIFWRK